MEGLLKLIMERRSIRNFTSQKVSIEEIYELLEAARWAPSGGNVQPLRYIIVTDREAIEAVKMVSPGLFDEPPAMIVICFNKDKILPTSQVHFIDLGTALQNILLMAYSKGLGCCPVASFDAEAVAELLSLPNKIKPVLLLVLGYPDGHPSPPPRLPLNELIVRRI